MKTKNQEEIEFLKGYIHYSPFARVLEVEALWDKAKNMKASDERSKLFFLAVESFFMQQETLYKFIKAVKEAVSGKSFLKTIKVCQVPDFLDSRLLSFFFRCHFEN